MFFLTQCKKRLIDWVKKTFAFLDEDWQADFGDDEDAEDEERCSTCCLSPKSQRPHQGKIVCIRCRQPLSA